MTHFLAYEMTGNLLLLHGYPAQAVFILQIGGWWVKWVVELIA